MSDEDAKKFNSTALTIFRAGGFLPEMRYKRVEHIVHLNVGAEDVFGLKLLLARCFRPKRVGWQQCGRDLCREKHSQLS